jgi:hypothetical protein
VTENFKLLSIIKIYILISVDKEQDLKFRGTSHAAARKIKSALVRAGEIMLRRRRYFYQNEDLSHFFVSSFTSYYFNFIGGLLVVEWICW